MSSDPTSMTREELIARLEELKRENAVVEDRLDAMTAQLENIKTTLVGSHDDFYQYEFNAENNVLDRLQDIEFRASRLENDVEGQDKLEKIIAHAERISDGEDVAVLDYK